MTFDRTAHSLAESKAAAQEIDKRAFFPSPPPPPPHLHSLALSPDYLEFCPLSLVTVPTRSLLSARDCLRRSGHGVLQHNATTESACAEPQR